MEESKLKKIVRKTILENFGSSSYPLSSVVFKKDEYEIPSDYYNDYFKAMTVEMNRGEFKDISSNMQIPQEFSDSEGVEYKLESIENRRGDYNNPGIINATYICNVDDIEFFVTLAFEYSTSVYKTGLLEFNVGGAEFEDKDYDRRLRDYMNGDAPRDQVMNK